MLVALSVQALEGPRLIEAHRVAVAEAAQEMESLLSQSPVLNEDRVKRLLGLLWAGSNRDMLRAASSVPERRLCDRANKCTL
jgi:hypothetical protein